MAADSKKRVFAFEEGDGKNKHLLGGKGANLCEMTQIGLNVPPGFVLSTEACLDFLASPTKELPPGLWEEVQAQMTALEKKTKKGFGSADRAVAGLGAFRLGHVHARHDGYHPQPGPQLQDAPRRDQGHR